MKPASQIILFSALLVFLFGCKKYPENNLWFKNPKNVTPFTGRLTEYRVNGIDSLELLSNYIANLPGKSKDINQCDFTTSGDNYDDRYSAFIVRHRGSVAMRYIYIKNKKYMNISNNVDSAVFLKNLFISKSIEWKIIRLAKSGPFKIETTLPNGNKYEISID